MHCLSCLFLLVEFLDIHLPAAECIVTPQDDLAKVFRNSKPGDTILLANGIWKDVEIKFRAVGTEPKPITLRAKEPGQAVLTGRSTLQVRGSYLIVDGLMFRDLTGSKSVIELRDKKGRDTHHCRITNCAMVSEKSLNKETDSKWINLHGHHNRVDHCYLAGKTSAGTTLVVWLGKEANYHQIDHNYFGARPVLGKNGGETIRVGTSEVSLQNSRTTVEYNLFEECDGEAEIISNKSCENVYRYNTFRKCAGALTLRHGNRCVVEANYFLGENKRGCGGVRIIGEDHWVVNNYFAKLQGKNTRGAVSFMNAQQNGPLNGYAQVRNAKVTFNTFVDCKYPLTIGVDAGKEQPLAPEKCTIAYNVFLCKRALLLQYVKPVNWSWQGNFQQQYKSAHAELEGIQQADLKFNSDKQGIQRPLANSPTLQVAENKFPNVTNDIDGQPRGKLKDAGCDQYGNSPERKPLERKNVGPTWWRAGN